MSLHYQCECHDCTQARWKMSFQGQISSFVSPSPTVTGVTCFPISHRWVDRIDEANGTGYSVCDECGVRKP